MLKLCRYVLNFITAFTDRRNFHMMETSNFISITSELQKIEWRQTGKPTKCIIDVSESPTARGSFDSRRRVCSKENLEFHASVLQYFIEKILCLCWRFWREFAQHN